MPRFDQTTQRFFFFRFLHTRVQYNNSRETSSSSPHTRSKSSALFWMFSLRTASLSLCTIDGRQPRNTSSTRVSLTLTNQSTRTETRVYHSVRLQPDSSSSTIFFCFVSICLMKTNWHSDEKCEHSTFFFSLLVHSSLDDDNSQESVSPVPNSAADFVTTEILILFRFCTSLKRFHFLFFFLFQPTTREHSADISQSTRRCCRSQSVTSRVRLGFDWTLYSTNCERVESGRTTKPSQGCLPCEYQQLVSAELNFWSLGKLFSWNC